jgi:hypothetical protein
MTWLRIDDKFPRHRKVAPLSDLAFRLHLTALSHAAEHLTDGLITRDDVRTFPSIPSGKKLAAAIASLEARGLWDAAGNSAWMLHDFLDWNPSAEHIRAKQAAACERMKRARSQSVRANNERTFARSSPNPVPTRPDPVNNPLPPEQKRDPMASSFSAIRADVLRVHQEYRQTFNLLNHKLRNAADQNAVYIAEAIDTHGEQACMSVLRFARQDAWVSGKADKGNKHEKISYIFGNPDTFARILRVATEREGRGTRQVSGSVAAARARAL